MAPYFLKNLLPKREQNTNSRTLWAALKTVTLLQWAHFFAG